MGDGRTAALITEYSFLLARAVEFKVSTRTRTYFSFTLHGRGWV
jgi:hypothetical protein